MERSANRLAPCLSPMWLGLFMALLGCSSAAAQGVAPPPVVEPEPAQRAIIDEAPSAPVTEPEIPRLHVRLRLHGGGLFLGKRFGEYASVGLGLRFGVAMPNGWSFDWETVGAFGSDPLSSTASSHGGNAQPLAGVIQLQTGPVVRRQFRLVYVDLGITIDNLWVLADTLVQMKLGGGMRAGFGLTASHRPHPVSAGLGLVGERIAGFAVVSVGTVIEARF